jgi:hypothetical protein
MYSGAVVNLRTYLRSLGEAPAVYGACQHSGDQPGDVRSNKIR